MKRAYTKIITILTVFLFMGSAYANNEGVNIHGLISQGYMKTTGNNQIADSKDGTFQMNEMGINFGHQPTEKLLIGIQFFARDLGAVGNDEIQVDYALADYRMKDYFGIRAGRMKNPMGVYSEYRDVDMLRTCIVLPFSVYDENLRDSQTFINGIGFYGDINTSVLGSISYQALLGTNNISEDSATAIYLGYGLTNITSVEMDTTYSYSLQYADPTGYFRFGGTAFFTDLACKGDALSRLVLLGSFTGITVPLGASVDFDVNNIEIYTSFFEITWKNLMLTYEFKYSKVRKGVVTYENQTAFSTNIDFIGRYIMLNYQLGEKVAICIYNDVYYPYRHDRHGHNPLPGLNDHEHWSEKWAFAARYDLNSNWLVKFETHYTDGSASVPTEYNTEDGVKELKEHWWLYAVKVSYNF